MSDYNGAVISPVPARDAICLDCRTLLKSGEACDLGPAHRVASLHNGHGRERLLTEVWGPPDVRRRLKQMAAAGSAGAAGSSLAVPGCEAGCEALTFDPGLAVVVMAAVGVGMLFYYAFTMTLHAVRKHKNRPRPNGAKVLPRMVRISRPNRGRITAGDDWLRTLSGARVLAHGLRLFRKHSNQSKLMLSDGECAGITLKTEAGGTLYIAPGRIRLEAAAGLAKEASPGAVASYLQALDGDYLEDPEELELFPHDRAEEITLRRGDRLEVLNQLENVADPRSQEGGYREAAASILMPVGVPRIRVLPRN